MVLLPLSPQSCGCRCVPWLVYAVGVQNQGLVHVSLLTTTLVAPGTFFLPGKGVTFCSSGDGIILVKSGLELMAVLLHQVFRGNLKEGATMTVVM